VKTNIQRRNFIIGAGAIAGTSLVGCANRAQDNEIFDSHCHIIDNRFPIVPNQGYIPPSFTLEEYRQKTIPLGITSGAIVSGSFHGYDQTYLRATLAKLGPRWVGITQVPFDISDQEILNLSSIGVRGLRFNIYRGRIDTVEDLRSLAIRVHDVAKWHAEIYADAAALKPHVSAISNLPQIVIDHMGMNEDGLPALLDLVDAGAKVKLTGFGRVNMNVPKAIEKIAFRNTNSLMFGTDLPSTRANRPFNPKDIQLVKDVLGPKLSSKALWSNAVSLYRPIL
jgi:predicted TIM-barrel fold metal-dependent hydrolase